MFRNEPKKWEEKGGAEGNYAFVPKKEKKIMEVEGVQYKRSWRKKKKTKIVSKAEFRREDNDRDLKGKKMENGEFSERGTAPQRLKDTVVGEGSSTKNLARAAAKVLSFLWSGRDNLKKVPAQGNQGGLYG